VALDPLSGQFGFHLGLDSQVHQLELSWSRRPSRSCVPGLASSWLCLAATVSNEVVH